MVCTCTKPKGIKKVREEFLSGGVLIRFIGKAIGRASGFGPEEESESIEP